LWAQLPVWQTLQHHPYIVWCPAISPCLGNLPPSRRLDPLRLIDWFVYGKPPSADSSSCWPISTAIPIASPGRQPDPVARRRQRTVSTWKNYRHDAKTESMALEAGEFIRRFLLHTLQKPPDSQIGGK
jgi:hypothetical protein